MKSENPTEKIGGIAATSMWALYLIGLLSVLFSVIAAVRVNFVGAGVCLAAAALAYGLLLNGLLRR